MGDLHLHTDIETSPTTSTALKDLITSEIEAPANYKDPLKIEQYRAEKAAEKIAKTALDALYGTVCMIGIAFNDGPVMIFDLISHGSERAVIQAFFDAWLSGDRRPVICGHNIKKFDLDFIFKRAVILGIKAPVDFPRHVKPWDNTTVHDTMTLWDPNAFTSLNALSKAMGGRGKLDVGGKFAHELLAGTPADVALARQYLVRDVEETRFVHSRIMQTGGSAPDLRLDEIPMSAIDEMSPSERFIAPAREPEPTSPMHKYSRKFTAAPPSPKLPSVSDDGPYERISVANAAGALDDSIYF